MIPHASDRHSVCDRRGVVRTAGLAAIAAAVGHAQWLRRTIVSAAERPEPAARARSCILLWLDGGPSHLETWDLKPDAPAEVRGPLSAIATSVPGIQISECLPLTATRLQRLAIVRSVTSPLGEHNLGTHYVLTGHQPIPSLEYPSFSSVGSTHHAATAGMLPAHVAVPDYDVGGSRFSGFGFLPPRFAPFPAGNDPAAADFQVRDLGAFPGLDLPRLSRRREFSDTLQRLSQSSASGWPLPPGSRFDQAFRLMMSSESRGAFEVLSESPEVRARYGMKTIGQSCLLARRLVERGVPFVTVNHRGWDTHAGLVTQLKDGYTGARQPVGLIPSLDQALAALIDDLQDRRLLDQTLILVMGEFGRTPKINAAGGRDHWPRVFSAVLAGGGVAGGQVVGASDRTGESPSEHPVTPADLVATVYSLLGIDPGGELHTDDGRAVRLTPDNATVIRELIS